jgi:hypothetical protein
MIKVRESLKEACQDCPLYEADLEVLEKRWIGQAVPDFDVTVICGRRKECDLLEKKFSKDN